METLQYLYLVLSGMIVVPIVSWLKSKLPTDFPLQQPAIAGILNSLLVYGLSQWFYPGMTIEQIITLALGAQVVSQFTHGTKKTYQENVITK